MLSGHAFRQVASAASVDEASILRSPDPLRAFLLDRVVRRFARITGLEAIVIPINVHDESSPEDASAPPAHPLCVPLADCPYCRESWLLHLAELNRRRASHWHRCDYGRLCAVSPVVCGGRCVAAVKIVCLDSMAIESFRRHVDLLDALVERAVLAETELLTRLVPVPADPAASSAGAASKPGAACEPRDRPRHPQVIAALQRIKRDLVEPSLTVTSIATDAGVHPDYLSHLFTTQVGQRMHRYIALRRVELAKKLLAETDWQVKRVARETGHANPNWFSHVFHTFTGTSPTEYRQMVRH